MATSRNHLSTQQRAFAPYQIEEADVVSADPRDSRSVAIRVSGGTTIRRCTGTTNVTVGQRVLVIMDRIRNSAVILGALQNQQTISVTHPEHGFLSPPANITLYSQNYLLALVWDFYPGNNDVCYEIQINATPAEDGNQAQVLVTKGSYYLYWCPAGTTMSLRIRALRWISDSNTVASSWSEWRTGTSTGINLAPYVVGPSSAVDGHLAVFDGTTGKLIRDGGALVNTGRVLMSDGITPPDPVWNEAGTDWFYESDMG